VEGLGETLAFCFHLKIPLTFIFSPEGRWLGEGFSFAVMSNQQQGYFFRLYQMVIRYFRVQMLFLGLNRSHASRSGCSCP